MYSKYKRTQGHLEQDREVSFICVPETVARVLGSSLAGFFWAVMLSYITIPWDDVVSVTHPYALILHEKRYPNTFHTFENLLHVLLQVLGLSDCGLHAACLDLVRHHFPSAS